MKKYSIFLLIGILSITMYSLSLVPEINVLIVNEVEAITFMDESGGENMTVIAYSNQTAIESNIDKEPIKFFGIQHAKSGSITEINATAYILELNEISEEVILFADRPNRIVKSESVSTFVNNWLGKINFTGNEMGGVLVVDDDDDDEKQEIELIELFNPVYNPDKKTLKYEITVENSTSTELSREFGQSTLVIDC